jgi:uncharacterized membrane protein YfbV (UPF0208 family)
MDVWFYSIALLLAAVVVEVTSVGLSMGFGYGPSPEIALGTAFFGIAIGAIGILLGLRLERDLSKSLAVNFESVDSRLKEVKESSEPLTSLTGELRDQVKEQKNSISELTTGILKQASEIEALKDQIAELTKASAPRERRKPATKEAPA